MNDAVLKQHEWLQRLVGEWRCEPQEGHPGGTESVRSLGGLWVVCEGHGEMPDGRPATMLMTLGYDPRKGRYVGTWVGSMMNWLWRYDGTLDAEQRVLTLDTEGPSFTAECQPLYDKPTRYRDCIELVGDDRRTLTSRVLGDDGEWRVMMTLQYQRC